MSILSGLQTAISGIPSVSRWTVETTKDFAQAVTAATNGGVIRSCGVEDWRATVLSIGVAPAYKPGDAISFAASLNGSVGVSGSGVVSAVRLNAEYFTNRFFTIEYEIQSDGILSFGTVSASDTTLPTPVCPAGRNVKLNDTSIDNIVACVVNLEKELLPYVATGTNGVVKRLPGVLIATVQLDMIMSSDFAIDDDSLYDIGVEVGDLLSWKVPNCRLMRVVDYGFDLSAAFPRRQPPIMRCVFVHSAESTSEKINLPGVGDVWP